MEYEFHNWLKQQIQSGSQRANVLVGIGDDAAVQAIDPQRSSLVVATDSIAEGTHFELPVHTFHQVGRKSLAVNLSDIAAMGAIPETAVLNFLLPKSFGLEDAQALFSGINELANQFNVAIIGGDTNRWDGRLVIGATVMGSLPSGSIGWSIGGGQVGDAIVVSGAFGGSIHGRHLSFEPRVQLANYLAKQYKVNAATDASDSLSLDLNAMVRQSGLGVNLDLDAIPISSDVKAADPAKRLDHALTDGEDFELILSISPTELERLFADELIETHLTRIGTVVNSHQEIQAKVNGETVKISPQGYVH